MRFVGSLKSWNHARGFGFIEPAQGGQEVFVHIKAFTPRVNTPQLNQQVSFEIEINPEGKKRAKNAQLIWPERGSDRRAYDSPAQWGTASYFAIPAFLTVYFVVALVWGVPKLVAAVYLGASVVCFIAYAVDKSAAEAGRWRTSENTLHFLGLACGWPGALLAQQLLRHKSNKASFRSAFWGITIANVVAFVVLCSPLFKSAPA